MRRRATAVMGVRNNPRVLVSVCDVGPRDGLQNDQVTLEPERPRGALPPPGGRPACKRIEAASFVHPRLVPQMAGAEEAFAQPPDRRGT